MLDEKNIIRLINKFNRYKEELSDSGINGNIQRILNELNEINFAINFSKETGIDLKYIEEADENGFQFKGNTYDHPFIYLKTTKHHNPTVDEAHDVILVNLSTLFLDYSNGKIAKKFMKKIIKEQNLRLIRIEFDNIYWFPKEDGLKLYFNKDMLRKEFIEFRQK